MRWKNWTFGLFIDNPVVLVAAVAIVACFLVIAVIENQDTINAIGNDITNAINDISNNIKGKSEKKANEKSKPNITYPGDNPAKSPGEDWEWKGKSEPGGRVGSWHNPKTKESHTPDLDQPEPIEPHWDYKRGKNDSWRIFPDGRIERK